MFLEKIFWSVAIVIMVAMLIFAAPFAHAMTSLEPFISFGELNGSYQGQGWVKGKFIVGCHTIEDEGPQEECSVSGDFVNVRQKPNGRIIGALSNGVPILVMKRRDNWVEVFTYCTDNLVPTSSHDGVRLYSCEERQK
jgi:hypothetical protein